MFEKLNVFYPDDSLRNQIKCNFKNCNISEELNSLEILKIDSLIKLNHTKKVEKVIVYDKEAWLKKKEKYICHICILGLDLIFIPRLLLLASVTSFLVGFFAQYILDNRFDKSKF